MAEEAPSNSTQIRAEDEPQTEAHSDSESLQYWCYHCEKRVAIETLDNLPDVICCDCKNGFVESIASSSSARLSGSAPPPPPPPPPSGPPSRGYDQIDDDSPFGNQFLQVLRLIAQAARDDDDAPPPPPSDRADPSDDDYLRIELDGWHDEDEDDEDNEEEDEDNRDDEMENTNGLDGDDDDNHDREMDEEDDEEDERRRRREVLRLRLRDFASRAANRRNRILDWAEILMGLEDHSIELRLHDTYVGNPGDYVDAAGYEALLQTLAETDSNGRRGAPPAAKAAIEKLETIVIDSQEDCQAYDCAVCKDTLNIGETVKKLPCAHKYHADCIVPWLGTRNTCPVCRFELPTDDPEYEEERKKKAGVQPVGESTSSGSGSAVRSYDYESID